MTPRAQVYSRGPLWRWLVFNVVGAMGVVVQLAALAVLADCLGMNYLWATAVAVEVSVLHNFVWHEHWTWADRVNSRRGILRRFWLFNAANGLVSIAGNVAVMRVLVGALALDAIVANLLAIAACSILNFISGDRLAFAGTKERGGRPMVVRERDRCAMSAILALAFLPSFFCSKVVAAELRPETIRAWTAYAGATEERISRELADDGGFLALDFQRQTAAAEKRSMLSGGIPVSPMKTLGSSGAEIGIPSGMIHHWRGSVFIPGSDLEDILRRVENPTAENTKQEDVLASKILDRGPDFLKLYLKLQRSKIVTVVYNTEHLVRYSLQGTDRAWSSSVATKIAELEKPNTIEEREKPEGHDRGFLWRLNSYWRYEQINGGVIVECESISLSRTIPAPLAFFVRPLIDRVAKESMHRTLESLRNRILAACRQPVARTRSLSEN